MNHECLCCAAVSTLVAPNPAIQVPAAIGCVVATVATTGMLAVCKSNLSPDKRVFHDNAMQAGYMSTLCALAINLSLDMANVATATSIYGQVGYHVCACWRRRGLVITTVARLVVHHRKLKSMVMRTSKYAPYSMSNLGLINMQWKN